MYTVEYFDPIRLVNPGYNDFLLVWDGKLNNGNCMPTADWVYNAHLIIKNCNQVFDEHIDITFWNYSGICNSVPPQFTNEIPNCCPEYAVIDNVYYSSDSRTDVNNYINIAVNAPVSFGNNTNVKFHAGNSINLGPNFINNPSANIEMKIVPCGTNKMVNTNLGNIVNRDSLLEYDPIEKVENIKAFPNPNHGIFYLVLPKADFPYDISIINPLGDLVWEKYNTTESNILVDLSNSTQGVYLVRIQKEASDFYYKIVII